MFPEDIKKFIITSNDEKYGQLNSRRNQDFKTKGQGSSSNYGTSSNANTR